MFSINFKISKNYAFESDFLSFLRSYKDGLTAFLFDFDSSWYRGDHNPRTNVIFVLFNLKIFEIGIYNVNHVETNYN